VKTLLVFAVPPLVGAFIGFVTNVIAIKMLFRPLRAIRLFGVRLPFTPGILPRQRHKLAESIGAMVERELLTPELLRRRLAQDDVRGQVYQSLARLTETILARPLGDSLSGAPPFDRGVLRSLADTFVYSPLCGSMVNALVMSLSGNLNRSLFEILDAALPPAGETTIEQRIEHFVAAELRDNAGLIVERFQEETGRQYSVLAEGCIQFLRRADTHRELEIHGRIFLAGAILKLNVFQRLFLSAAQYDRTLSERMPEIIDDLIDQIGILLKDDSTRRRLLNFLGASMDRMLSADKPLMSRLIAGLLITEGKKPLGELLPALGIKELAAKLIALLRTRREEESGIWQALKKSLLEQCGGLSLGTLLSISDEKKKTIDEALCSRLLNLADEQIENVLSSINVRTLVSERIDSLEMIRVERIVLDVMANQLKWIDIFGAILGFLIGLFQVLFNWLLR
jgi:uncharacterized membrane protein YheB (UPF0754 family)